MDRRVLLVATWAETQNVASGRVYLVYVSLDLGVENEGV